mmetsp:Transcript_15746/g.54857  ORF Transcript_15746/g.54857 Transcript_15746/m.54857 type:complete len:696 (-) Transcript_15746:11-2098(-)
MPGERHRGDNFVAKPHRWTRDKVQLPRDEVEGRGLPAPSPRVLARYWNNYAGVKEVDGPMPTPEEAALPLVRWQREVSEAKKEVESKYLLTALLPFTPRRQKGQCGSTTVQPYSAPAWDERALQRCGTPEFAEQVVEAPTSLTVITEEGPMKVPPRFWLVVESDGRPQASEDGTEEPPPLSLLLSLRAGGGRISEESAALLRPVAEHRLHAAAAEANFQRASRATSLVALRHAARILEIMEERGLGAAEAPKAADIYASRSSRTSSRACSTPTQARVRMQRAKFLVAGLAAAATKRAESPPSSARADRNRQQDMPPIERGNRSRVMLQKGVLALEDFNDFVTRQFGNPVRAWFKLDVDENMKLGEKQFIRRALEIGFRGNIPALWRYLDSDQGGSTSLLEIDIGSTIILAGFKKFITEACNDSVQVLFNSIDDNRSGKVWKGDFAEKIPPLGYSGPAPRLFDLLDRQGLGFLVLKDFEFLGKWKPQHYLYCEPDDEGLQRFKEAVIELYGEPIFRVWRKVLDRDGSMRINWDEFRFACLRILRSPQTAVNSIPKTEVEMAGVWRAMDRDCAGFISLREFDPAAYQALGSFRIWTQKHYGSIQHLFRILDDNGNGRVSLAELSAIKKGPDGYTGNVPLVFACLDVNCERLLTDHEVKFLDSWDVWWEEYETTLRKRRHTFGRTKTAKVGQDASASR